MSLDIQQTVVSSFERIKSRATPKLLGMGIALASVLIGGLGVSGALAAMEGSMAALAAVTGLATGVVYLAGVAMVSVGSFRGYEEGDLTKEMLTENIFWPFLRITGVQMIIQTFAMFAIYALAYPALIFGGIGSGLMAGGLSSGASGLLAAGIGIIGAAATGVILYVIAALAPSIPRIAVDDMRMFASLDESVQATSGNRLRIIATFLPGVLLIAGGVTAMAAIGGLGGLAIYAVMAAVGSFYVLGVLTELNSRL